MAVRRLSPAWLSAGMVVVVAALVAGRILLPSGGLRAASYLVVAVGAAVVGVAGLSRGSVQRHWRWIALSVALSAAGDAVFQFYVSVLGFTPDVSWADPFWLLSYVALAIGASGVLGLRGPDAGYRDAHAVIDMLSAAVVGTLVVWTVALEPTFNDESIPVTTRLVWSSYPILDVALLSALVGGMLSVRGRQRAAVMLCAGLGCWLASDFGFLLAETNGFDITTWLDAGWMIGAALLGTSVWHAEAAPSDLRPPRSVNRVRLLMGLVPLIVPPVLEVTAFHRGVDPNPWPLAVGTVAFVGLAYARWTRLVRQQERAAAELDSSERYYRALAVNSSDAVLVVSRDGRILRESSTFARLASLQGTIVGLDVSAIPSVLDSGSVQDLLRRAARAPGELVTSEMVVRPPGEVDRWFAVRVMDMVDDEAIGGIVVNLHDITARKAAEEELRFQAFRDPLTGLANRALFRDRVGHALESRERSGQDAAVLFVDLDEFKVVNDTLGHDAGDQLLMVVATRLSTAVRAGDTVARLGGDEFAILIESDACETDGPSFAERILRELRQPIELGERSLFVTCSIGIALSDPRSDVSELLRHADMAMYEAKASGKARWAKYDPAMGEATRVRLDLEADIRDALDRGEIALEYQPIIDIASGRLSGFEALLRWNHPNIGPVPPDQFVPILESNGQIVEIGNWVLEQACGTIADWTNDRALDAPQISIAVNVSSVQLTRPDFVSTVERIIRSVGIEPTRVVLEITETGLVDDPASASARLAELRLLGVRVAIDDFGTGYSSLNYLHQLPCDTLKMDRTFIDSIEPGEPMPAIVRGVLDLARTLGIEVVAEGIQDAHQLSELKKGRCDKGQGFFFASPLSPEDARRWMEDRSRAVTA